MYKTASRNQQKKQGRDTSRRIRAYEPKSKPQVRKWWYPVIAYHAGNGRDIREHYGKRFPDWLYQEINRLTPVRWLETFCRKSGMPNKRAPVRTHRRKRLQLRNEKS